jgi:aspartyl-tRNA(Asn)/glutamyl-tRNA(Gln) amidotransferase subunit A
MTLPLEYRSATQLRADYVAGRASPVEVMTRVLQRIEEANPRINAFWLVNESAMQQAQAAERAIRDQQPLGVLHGVPISIKDLIATAGLRTTRGSAMFADWVPNFSAPVVERAVAAGAILVGKTSTAEFGWKGVTDAPLFGATRNPWNLDFTPGGSSGGAAAAVAAGMGPLAVATDAAGSTRLPAAFCNVFGFKPSFGRIPVAPAPAADSLVHVGVLSRTVADCSLFLSVVAGPDERDRNSLPTTLAEEDEQPILTAAWCPDFGKLPIEAELLSIYARALDAYAKAGLRIEEVKIDLPEIAPAFHTLYHGLFGAQLADALAKWRDKLDPGLVAMVEAGRKLSAYELTKAGMARSAYYDALRKVFERYEALLLPVAGTAGFRLGCNVPVIHGEPAGYPDWLGFLYPFNLGGQPAASVPCGWTAGGLPVGLQVAGRRFADSTVLRVAAFMERALPWAQRTPAL